MYRIHVLRALCVRVRNNAHYGFGYLILRAEERDDIAVTFAHFLAVRPGDDRKISQYLLFRKFECFSVLTVEFPRYFTGIFNMLFLILPYRNDIRVVEQNVARHENGVIEKPDVRFEAARFFVFVGMREFQEGHGDEGVEYPGKLCVLGDLRLLEDDDSLGINSYGKIVTDDISDIFPEFFGIFESRQGVVIRHHQMAFVPFVHVNKRLKHAKIVPYMECSRRLEPGQKLLHISLNIAENSAN